MRAEVYVSECCGALFVPGFGPDNIVENHGDEFYDAVREGKCPSCNAMNPEMMEVFTDGLRGDPGENGDDGYESEFRL